MKTECKRMTVTAIGIDSFGETIISKNGNYDRNGCTGEVGNCGCRHAESELLNTAPDISIIFLSHSPCIDCAKRIVRSDVTNVFYNKEYRITDGIKLLKRNGILVKQIDFNLLEESI